MNKTGRFLCAVLALVCMFALCSCSATQSGKKDDDTVISAIPEATATNIPPIKINTPTSTPVTTPTVGPQMKRTWLEAYASSPAAIKRTNGNAFLCEDNFATGAREEFNDMEQSIFDNGIARLDNGAMVDFDGNGTREQVFYTFDYEYWMPPRIQYTIGSYEFVSDGEADDV